MNLVKLAYKNTFHKKLNSTLNISLIAVSVAIISFIMLLTHQVNEHFKRNLLGTDMVVGAKGSPLQLILANIYHIDHPTGNIPYPEAEKLMKHRQVKSAIPLAYGDNFKGYRILGTNHDYLKNYNCELNEGRLWKDIMEVTVGSVVARLNGLKIGDRFYGTHGSDENGHQHQDSEYKVVGILDKTGTVLDHLVLTNVESVWAVHHHEDHDDHDHSGHDHGGHVHDDHSGHDHGDHAHDDHSGHDHGDHAHDDHSGHDHGDHAHDDHSGHDHGDHAHHDHGHAHRKIEFDKSKMELTALLIKFKNPMMGATQMPRYINTQTPMQAALPKIQIPLMMDKLGVGVKAVQWIGIAILIISGVSVFISLLDSLSERKYELSIMRCLGATSSSIFLMIVLEGIILAVVGLLSGIVVSRVGILLINRFGNDLNFKIDSLAFIPVEYMIILGTIVLGIISAIIPALMAYKTNISETLSTDS